VPLTESLPELRWRGPNAAALVALAQLWGDSVLAERAARVAQGQQSPSMAEVPY
jgi:hypothetical protein